MMRPERNFNRIKVHPIAGSLGAEIEGVSDLKAMDAETHAEVRQAWLDNMVVFFRDQTFDLAEFDAMAAKFGKATITFYVKPMAGTKYLSQLVRKAETKANLRNYGDRWHMDQTIRQNPNSGFLLYSKVCPPYGGDTMFSNLQIAYDNLSPGMQALCDRLIVIHTASGLYGKGGDGAGGSKSMAKQGSENHFNITQDELAKYLANETEQPLVRVHPETGKKGLFLAGDYCTRFKDMTEAESRPLIDYLQRWIERPEFTCRFRWSQGAVALIDNRCLQHIALNDYSGFEREMWRTEFEDSGRPYGPAMPLENAQQAAE